MKCPHCEKPLFRRGDQDLRLFMPPSERNLFDKLCEQRLVRHLEVSQSKQGAHRVVEQLRKTLKWLKIDLAIVSVRGLGWILIDPADQEKAAHYGLTSTNGRAMMTPAARRSSPDEITASSVDI